jgi:hypothetical protein
MIHEIQIEDKGVIKIETDYDKKPVPYRGWDWIAWESGNEENGSAVGFTEQEAIDRLIEKLSY